MLERLFGLLAGGEHAASQDGRQLAVAALLIEAAYIDDHFGTQERQVICRLLQARFGLTEEGVCALLEEAERQTDRSTGLFRFTSEVVQDCGVQERIEIIEMLWEVAYADGVLDPEEDMLIRRIAGLIHVEDFERGAARQRVLSRLKPRSPWARPEDGQ